MSDVVSRHSKIKSNAVGLDNLSPSGEVGALEARLCACNIPVSDDGVGCKCIPSNGGDFNSDFAVLMGVDVNLTSISY